jgi:preprotein translocase subunit YajC
LIMAILLLLFIAWTVYISLRDQRREQQKQAQQRRIDKA